MRERRKGHLLSRGLTRKKNSEQRESHALPQRCNG